MCQLLTYRTHGQRSTKKLVGSGVWRKVAHGYPALLSVPSSEVTWGVAMAGGPGAES